MVKQQIETASQGHGSLLTGTTRHSLLNLLKLQGPMDAQALAQSLEVSAMAVRQHLYALMEEGFVAFSEVPRPVGRPAKHWALTDAANRFFPDAHGELTSSLLGAMRDVFGADGLDKLIQARTSGQIAEYAAKLDQHNSLVEKLSALAQIRTSEGYMAHVEEIPGSQGDFLLIENHCPICVAAQACSGLCASELTVFRAALGPNFSVERTDHLLSGARRCAYRVSPR